MSRPGRHLWDPLAPFRKAAQGEALLWRLVLADLMAPRGQGSALDPRWHRPKGNAGILVGIAKRTKTEKP